MPRVNVTVTDEQHALLLELSELQGGSAAGFLRQQLDASTPLLRAAVPLLRQAAQEMALSRAEASKLLEEPLRLFREAGIVSDQLELLEDGYSTKRRAPRSERSKRGREKRGRASAPPSSNTGVRNDLSHGNRA